MGEAALSEFLDTSCAGALRISRRLTIQRMADDPRLAPDPHTEGIGMSYRRWISFPMALAFAATLASSVIAQQRDAEVALQQAMQVEQVQGDLERAIRLYRDIIAHHGDARAVAAKGLLQLGQCYEKLGRTEATNAYQRLVREYGDQSEMVAAARARLAALQPAVMSKPGPIARLLLNPANNPSDRGFDNPRVIVPSPDGHRIAYWQSGPETKGVYIRNLSTGEDERVATGGPTERFLGPIWSADARQLAFTVTDTATRVSAIRILDLVSRDVRTLSVPDGRRPYLVDWTRDGRLFLCNDLNSRSLHLVAVNDGAMTTVSDSVWPWIRATFSPDGRFVVYGYGAAAIGSRTVYVQPVTGGPRHEIAKTGDQMYPHPLWSPDGSAIAYQEADGIWVVPVADGMPSGPKRLAYRTESPRWAVAWAASGGLYYTANEQQNIPWRVEVDPSTGRAAGSAPEELVEYPRGVRTFNWSPDGRQVAITGWSSDLTVYSLDTRASTSYEALEQDGGIQLSGGTWSPDGRELWYEHVSSSPDNGRRMKALDLTTGQVRGLFTLMNGGEISLSADAHTMAFVRPGSDAGDVEIVVAETGKSSGRVVATLPGPDGIPLNRLAPPRLSPSGDRVLYVVQQPPRTEHRTAALWAVGADGAGGRRLAEAARIFSATWDPSGRFIAYTGKIGEADTANTVLRVLDLATGAEHDIPMPRTGTRLHITDWSRDGRFIGFIKVEFWWEYWVVEGLLDGGH
jgi:Tol biopolymer transport system component